MQSVRRLARSATIPEMTQTSPEHPIAVFDSGVGGLTVLHELLVSLPTEDYLYLGDTARFPYGTRTQEELQAFADKVRRASKELGEGAQAAEKDGLDTGIRAKNPFTGKEIPVWVANFVLSGYGTGAVMAVPAHDQRDYEFATKFGLSIVPVVRPADDSELPKDKAYVDYGVLFDSGEFSGMPSEQARLAIAAEAQRRGIGKPAVNYHLRDWGISRQRYWGTPIPIVYCPKDDPKGRASRCQTRSCR